MYTQQARGRMPIKMPVNPADKSTVVSIYPWEINEFKETLIPGHFHLDSGSFENPAVLTVGTCSWYRDVNPEQELMEVQQQSVIVADSIVNDFCVGVFGYKKDVQSPGLFWVTGEHTSDSIKKNHMSALLDAQKKQRAWYLYLVQRADADWARSNGNPLAISDQAKRGAQELGLQKDWLRDFAKVEMINCVACGTMVKSNVIVCPNCKVVLDAKRFADLKLNFA